MTVALLCSANRQIAFFSKLDPGLTTRSGVSERECWWWVVALVEARKDLGGWNNNI